MPDFRRRLFDLLDVHSFVTIDSELRDAQLVVLLGQAERAVQRAELEIRQKVPKDKRIARHAALKPFKASLLQSDAVSTLDMHAVYESSQSHGDRTALTQDILSFF